jgi:predicted Fe-Mo cluster-binding NifX family protein
VAAAAAAGGETAHAAISRNDQVTKGEQVVMTIAIPLVGKQFSSHFGGADAFVLYTVDEGDRSVSERRVVVPPEHGRGIFPMWLRQLGASVVIAGGMGPRASGILAQHGIRVVLGAQGDDPDAMVRSFLDGSLVATGEPCHDHGFHDCGHHSPRQGGCGGHDHDD